MKTGNIVDTEKNILGKHKGLSFYTIGQRKGLGILSKKPMYVVSMNNKKNEIIVGNDSNVYSNMLIAGDLNFIVNKLNKKLQKIEIKIRYNSKLAFATINPIEGQKVRVEFQTPQRAITPGQSVVFYNKDVVLGGGIILK